MCVIIYSIAHLNQPINYKGQDYDLLFMALLLNPVSIRQHIFKKWLERRKRKEGKEGREGGERERKKNLEWIFPPKNIDGLLCGRGGIRGKQRGLKSYKLSLNGKETNKHTDKNQGNKRKQ
jgi:hypothetical protein